MKFLYISCQRQIFRTLILIIVFFHPAYGFNKTGSSAAQFLKIGVGARAPAMGGNFVALADDPTALYWNPAGIAKIKKPTVTGVHTMLFADISHEFIGFVLPFNYGALGLSATSLGSGEMEITTIEEPDGTGASFRYGCLSFGVSYATYLTDRFITGMTVKYIQESIYNEKASTFAMDIGTQLQTDFWGIRIGMCMSNFGGNMKLEGRDLITTSVDEQTAHLETSSWPLPLNFRVGIATDIIGIGSNFIESNISQLTVAIDANHSNDNVERVGLGLEYQVAGVSIRTGYSFPDETKKLSFGVGISTNIGSRAFKLNYAFTDFGCLGGVHIFSIEIRW